MKRRHKAGSEGFVTVGGEEGEPSRDEGKRKLKARDGRRRRRRDLQERERAAMYAAIERVYGPQGRDGEALLERVAAEEGKAGPLTLIRGSTLANLYARGSLTDRQMRAAVELREKWRFVTGGMPAMNWMREKVDGGRLFVGPAGGLTSALDADRQIREALKASGMGLLAAEVLLRVVCEDEALKAVALDFEDDVARRETGRRERMEPTRDALGYSRQLLRDGLGALADHWYGRERRRDSLLGNALHTWLTVDRAR